MLGWEFPPIINGGLGVACYGLSKALSPYVNLTMIIPKTDPSFIVENVELIGLNKVDIQSLKTIDVEVEYEKFTDLNLVDANFLPYNQEETSNRILTESTKYKDITKHLEDLDSVDVEDLYAGDILANVIKYANIATKIALTKEFDIIHAHDWMTFLAGVQIKKKTGKPLVLHIHATEIDRSGPESKGNIFQIEKSALDVANAVIPVSSFTGQILQEYYGVPESKIFPVHNGVDAITPYKKPKKTDDKLVMYLGRLTSQKGPEYFLDMAEKVIEKVPNVRFVMAGTGDKFRELIDARAEKKLGNKFHFTGFLNGQKVKELFSIADVYCMPSVSEPFGLSALEAAQFGIPTVISKQSGVAEVLKSALTADFWDVYKMADNIISLLTNDELYQQVVEGGYEDLKKLTWDESAKHVLEVYAQLKPNKR
jgi:glycosyltransferase involved in cell wall biosynthesis